MLGDAKVDEHGNVLDHDDDSDIYFDKDAEDHEINVWWCSFPPWTPSSFLVVGWLLTTVILACQIKSALCFLRGKAYEALDNRDLARQW
jgi:anaphase-promoting complex subunit 6